MIRTYYGREKPGGKMGQEHFLLRPRGCKVGGDSLRIDAVLQLFSFNP
jgi:hypothetical protein